LIFDGSERPVIGDVGVVDGELQQVQAGDHQVRPNLEIKLCFEMNV
jgi:hypothetical protein